jgi:hypothetical protein
MKILIVITMLFVFPIWLYAQEIGYAEYFLDNDPGFGNATEIEINAPLNELSLNFNINTSLLSSGWHQIGIRAQNTLGNWGTPCNRIFYLATLPPLDERKIFYAEYFIDTDPGFGLAYQIEVDIPDYELTLNATANLTNLNSGIHYLGIRAAEINGRWSSLTNRFFYYADLPMSTFVGKAEYFIDNDPGNGNGTPFIVNTPDNQISLDITDNLNDLEQGIHELVVRAANTTGKWGPGIQRVFYLIKDQTTTQSNVQELEYFFDSDPGFCNGYNVNVGSPGDNLIIDFEANLSGLSSGDHIIYIRAKSTAGRWGHLYAESFNYTVTGLGTKQLVSLFRIFPNPGKNEFLIQFPEANTESNILNIKDINGKVLFEEKCNQQTHQFSVDLKAGIYIIEVKAGNRHSSQKLIIY